MGDHHLGAGPDLLDILGPLLAVIGIVGYLALAGLVRGRRWPWPRSVLWVIGSVAAAYAVSGPLATAAATSYLAHMITHLLLAMLAPLLLVLAAPITLLLRSLPVRSGRRLSRVLRSWPMQILTEPGVAAVLNVGSLWLLYTTGLYPAMHESPVVHVLVHAHLFLAGYLFTASMISVDPLPHRRSFAHRSIVLILAVAAHDTLAKYLYAHPPIGVSGSIAETGSMVMYYGGDAVEVAMIIVLCARWYRLAGRGRQLAQAVGTSR